MLAKMRRSFVMRIALACVLALSAAAVVRTASTPKYYNRVLETTTTTGTGTLTLAGAVTGFQTWAVLGNGNSACYYIEAVDANGVPTGAWEAGLGTYTSSGTTLSRDTVDESSNSNSLVSFGAGTKRVGLSPCANKYLYGWSWVNGQNAITNADATLVAGTLNVVKATTGAHAITLPAAADGVVVSIEITTDSTKLLTLTRAGSDTIDTATTRVMWAGESATLVAVGTEWRKVAGKTIPMVCELHLGATQTIASGSFVKIGTGVTYTAGVDNTGLMADTTNKRCNALRPGSWTVTAIAQLWNTDGSGLAGGTAPVYVAIAQNGTAIDSSQQFSLTKAARYAYLTTTMPGLTAALNDTFEAQAAQYTDANQAFSVGGVRVVEVASW